MTHLIIFSGRSTLLELPLGTSKGVPSFDVQETARIGFEVDDYDERVTYQITIGDIPLAEEPQERRTRLEWLASSCLDGASGITPISLRDAANGTILARSLALVEPSKLSTSAYETMIDDMRRISVKLLLDLISKSRLTPAQSTSPRHGGVQSLTARLELSQIRRFWQRFSLILVPQVNQRVPAPASESMGPEPKKYVGMISGAYQPRPRTQAVRAPTRLVQINYRWSNSRVPHRSVIRQHERFF